MPHGRPRNSKRTSSNSYASTITTIVFFALCAFGLWILNSNSLLLTRTTTRSISDPSSSSSNSVSINSPFTEKANPPPVEDEPLDLPHDSISTDDNDSGDQSTPAEKELNQRELITEEKQRANEENEIDSTPNEQVSNSEEKPEDTENIENEENVNSESDTKEAVEDQEQRSESGGSEDVEKDQNDEDGATQTEEDQQSDQLESEIQENPQESENIQQLKEDQENPQDSENIQQLKEDQENPNPTTNDESTTENQISSEDPISEQSEGDKPLQQPDIPKESTASENGWSTQAGESENEKERRKEEPDYAWRLCNVTAGTDYIPCLDNEKALKKVHKTGHYEHRERHCPEEGPTCLVPLPDGYKRPIPWPTSRSKIWYKNVPHTKLAEVKGHQNWVKITGEYLTFPGGGTQFIHGALHYIDFIQKSAPKIRWGQHTRVILDVGCGVASFGGYLFDRNVIAMSFAPKDEHEAQVQFALERGIPAISAVMGSKRLPFPSGVFDLVHCARCRVPWHADGGLLLLELNRVLRPGGFFVWSATPVYQKLQEDVEIWKAMSSLTAAMCWELFTIKKDRLNGVGAAVYRKPSSNYCYDQRQQNRPPMCESDDDPNAAWYVPLQPCMHRVPVDKTKRGSKWPEDWPLRLQTPPYWLNSSQIGIYGRPAPEDFVSDYEHWKEEVNKTYINGLGISLSNVRNVMDMRSVYGGFAAALKDLSVWVMNVVNVDSPDTLPIIYERGLFGIYHDWCESFSTYPRTYDLLHADHLFSKLKNRCKLGPVMAELDRIVRPGGTLIVRDEPSAIEEVESFLKSLRWEVHLIFTKDQEGVLSAQKGDWRPEMYSDS